VRPLPASAGAVVDVTEVIERTRLGPFQLRAFSVIAGCLVMDGFDLQAMGYAAPALVRDWGIPPAALGGVFSAGLLGLFLGAILFGALADRLGRRPALLVATAWFAACTLLTARAGSLPELVVARALAGLGIGGVMPNATALVGEYSPRRRKVATMMIVTNAFLVGGILGGALSAWLIPRYGWRSVFWAGGLLPLAALAAMLQWLPESLQLLVLRGRSPSSVARWLRRVDPAAPRGPGVRYTASEERREGFPVLQLFRERRALGTTLLWAASFLNVMGAYFVSSWLPTLLSRAGHATTVAVLTGTALQLGGAIGTVVLGLVQRKVGLVPLLAGGFATAAVSLAVIGTPALPLAFLVGFVTLAGVGLLAGPPMLNALAATWYPTDLRSTGVGAGLGVGRFGAILGPLVASELVARQWSMEGLFRAAAVPALLATAVAAALPWVLGARGAGFVDPVELPATRSALAVRAPLAAVTRAGARLVAVGQRGHVLLSDDGGGSWTQAAVPVSTDLTAVHFPTASRGFAVGHDGIVLSTEDGGRTWTRRRADPTPDAALLDVWFADERTGFAVGAFNLLLSTEDGGESWTAWGERVENPRALHLHAVRGVGGAVLVVGEQGLILRLEAGTRRFRAVPAPRGGSLFGLVASGDDVVAFGLGGRAVRSGDGGASWRAATTGVDGALAAGTVLPDGRLVLVSQAGRVFASGDGGRSFRPAGSAGGRLPPAASVAVAGPETLVIAGPAGLRRERLR
jgi:AAHS family 4-hydroxybenzoate transporter-like MFS transporter